MTVRPCFRWALALMAVWCAGQACALDFRFRNPSPDGPQAGLARGLAISGAVVPGDSDRLLALVRSQPANAWFGLGHVELQISGGDQKEALMLADLLAPLYPHLTTASDCSGACAIVWLSGAWRLLPQARIGLHPPPRADHTGQRPSDAPPPYDPLPDQLRNYYLRQGLPATVYEQWMGRAPTVWWLSDQDVNATGTWPPYYYEKIHAQCPRLSGSEESFHALRRCAARLAISQRAAALDRLLTGVNDPWWNANRALLLNAPR